MPDLSSCHMRTTDVPNVNLPRHYICVGPLYESLHQQTWSKCRSGQSVQPGDKRHSLIQLRTPSVQGIRARIQHAWGSDTSICTLKSMIDVASARLPTTGPNTKVGLIVIRGTPSSLENFQPASSAAVCVEHLFQILLVRMLMTPVHHAWSCARHGKDTATLCFCYPLTILRRMKNADSQCSCFSIHASCLMECSFCWT